ncbi:uncharacterized protein PAC_11196 [Phialocephala subalpina]|uniref:Glycosyltransferase family 8 protein n=1 Tax=Phialocephala subalpina TaxID=576137 RepID=A0A1L7X8F4_9HELO|nr:uncharacterized protein PAC_11196 [Phialocephala subalpina]
MAVSPKAQRRPKKTFSLFPALLVLVLLLIAYRQLRKDLLFVARPLRVGDEEEKVAFATLLLPPDPKETNLVEAERYFTSSRTLNYQLQHCKSTRSKTPIPFLVLTTPDVPHYQAIQLADEGATIIPIDLIPVPTWVKPGVSRWQNVMSKLRLFELTSYSRILFLDADTFILHPMDGIFSDPFSYPTNTSQVVAKESKEALLPPTYLFASLPEVLHTTHPYPPHAWKSFNAGFFLFSPSILLFNYYLSLLNTTNKFDPTYPEQSLLNHAHREWGNMPWQRLSGRKGEWNINLPNMNDVRRGVRSVHAKLWWEGTELQRNERELRRGWEKVRGEMERFYYERKRGHRREGVD